MGTKAKNKAPLIERAGIWYLKKLTSKKPPVRIDIKTYVLDNQERANINRIEKWAIINVSVAGAISSIISGLAAFFADPLNDVNASLFSENNITFWVIVLGVTIIASLIELVYIYYDIMAKTYALASAAHMDLFPKDKEVEIIAAPIVRAALELPNKKEKDLNIDPKKESSKVFILITALFYRLKISVTNFILKAFVKRTLGRAISRAWLNFLSVPVCAFWNGLVCWFAIREVKIRVLGPSAVNEILNILEHPIEKMSSQGKLSTLRAIGSSIVRTADLHPNLEYMFRSFTKRVIEPHDAIFDDSSLFLDELKDLPENEKRTVLKTLVYATIIDGRINYREKRLLQKAYQICGVPFNYSNISELLKRFRNGRLLEFKFME
jgi:hypothetical protein